MREDKDDSATWLITHHGDAILRLGGVHGFTSWRPSQTKLAHPRQQPDGLLEVTFPDQPDPDLYVIEVATYPERRAEEQAVRDGTFVWLTRQVLPEVVTVVLHPKGKLQVTGEYTVVSRRGGTRLTGKWNVIDLWTRSAEDLLAMNDVGVIPWVPLTQSTAAPDVLLRQCRERIDQQARDEERQNLLAVTQVMTRLRYNEPSLLAIFGGREMIIESPLIQELLCEELHNAIIGFLEGKFGPLPADLCDRVRAIQEVDALRTLSREAGVSPDLDAFRAKLPS
jgi:predicted transposase YdaD